MVPAVLFGRNYFLDTEFNRLPNGQYDLISIGIVDEAGREFYAESRDFDESSLDPWLLENVIPLLGPRESRQSIDEIREGIDQFVLRENMNENGHAEKAVFWAKNGSQDWVILMNNIYGDFQKLPEHFQKWYHELYQLASEKGVCVNGSCKAHLPQQEGGLHNALEDARFNKRLWDHLTALPEKTKTHKPWGERVLDRVRGWLASLRS